MRKRQVVQRMLLLLLLTCIAAGESGSEFSTVIPEEFEVAQALEAAAENIYDTGPSHVAQNHTILSDGDNVTCIPVAQQLSLKSPIAPLQLAPSFKLDLDSYGGNRTHQTFKIEFGQCPEGTIPVRAPRDIFNMSGTEASVTPDYGAQSSRAVLKKSRPFVKLPEGDDPAHEHAFTFVNDNATTTPQILKGAHAIFNVWSPFVENKYEFSLAQLWLISGSLGNATNKDDQPNTIEVGYQVYEGLYGDKKPRLFVYWTTDGYNQTGCYNLGNCAGFVQVSNKVLIGGSFANASQKNSTQYEIEITVLKDNKSGNWWLFLEDEAVGYWPGALYRGSLGNAAKHLEFGGEIVDDEGKDEYRHTKTEMGSGWFPSTNSINYKFVAYQRNLLYADDKNEFHPAPLLNALPEAPLCYSSTTHSDQRWGSHFFYGGSGLFDSCKRDPSLYNTSSLA